MSIPRQNFVATLSAGPAKVKEALEMPRQGRIEIALGGVHHKAMQMDMRRCGMVAGVQKELAMLALAYNLVRRVMEEASRRWGVVVERISFVNVLRWLQV